MDVAGSRSTVLEIQALGSGSPSAAPPLRLQAHLGLGPHQQSPLRFQAHGNTALHMAAALPPGPLQEAIVRHLLAAGADPTLRNLENEQPVHLLRPGPGPEGVSTGLTSELTGGPPTALNTDLVSEGDLGPSPLLTKSDLCQVLSSYNPKSWKTKAASLDYTVRLKKQTNKQTKREIP